MTREQMIKAQAPDCARFIGYGGKNDLVYNWHRLEIRFPARRLKEASLEQMAIDTGAICMNDWDTDDLVEYAAMMQFRCSDIGHDESLERLGRNVPVSDVVTYGFARA